MSGTLADADLIAVRDQLYQLAAVVCRFIPVGANGASTPEGTAIVDVSEIEERAAILEFDAGLPRATAERIASGPQRNRRQ